MDDNRTEFFKVPRTLEERTGWYAQCETPELPDMERYETARKRAMRIRNAEIPIQSWLSVGGCDGQEFRFAFEVGGPSRLVLVEPCKRVTKDVRAWIQRMDLESRVTVFDGGIEDFESYDLFEIVTFFELIEHFTQSESIAMVEKCWSFVEPGGELWVSTPHKDREFGCSNPDPCHLHFFDAAALEEFLVQVTHGTVEDVTQSINDPILLFKVTKSG